MTSPTILRRKFNRNLQDYGSRIALRKTLNYLLGFIYDFKVYRIYVIDLSRFVPSPPTKSKFIYKFIGPGDTDEIHQIEEIEEWLTGQVRRKLLNGALCLVALENDIVAGFNLVEFGEIYLPLVKMKILLREGKAWSVQITVHKNYRRGGLGSDLRYRMFEELQLRGIRKFYGATLSYNVANLKLSRRVGLKEIIDIEYSQVLNIKRWAFRRIP